MKIFFAFTLFAVSVFAGPQSIQNSREPASAESCSYRVDGELHCGSNCGYKKEDGKFHCGDICNRKWDGQIHCSDKCNYGHPDGKFHCGEGCGYKQDGKFHCDGD